VDDNSPQTDQEKRPEDKFQALKKETEEKYGINVTENADENEEKKEEFKEEKPEKGLPKVKIPKVNVNFNYKKIAKFGLVPLLALLMLAGYSLIIHKLTFKYFCMNCEIKELEIFNPFGSQLDSISFGVDAFDSKEEFIEYIESAASSGEMGLFGGVMLQERSMALDANAGLAVSSSLGAPGGAGAMPSRVSTTNVQVTGIDEPDIVKTDGKNIFTSIQ